MTESEWLESTNPTLMLEFLRGKASERKLRLFACASSRKVLSWLTDAGCQTALEVAERYADALATANELRFARKKAMRVKSANSLESRAHGAALSASFKSAFGAAYNGHLASNYIQANFPPSRQSLETYMHSREDAFRATCHLMRDIFGNPFRPITINPVWLTPTVTNLAKAAYEERGLPSGELDSARLAVLSDALEEAGCNNAEMLSHLRSPGPHVRGCWALDLVLGKE